MSQYQKADLYVAGVNGGARVLADELQRLGIKAATILAALGIWEGETEPVYQVTIIEKAATEAHIEIYDGQGPIGIKDPAHRVAIMPGNPTAFANKIRKLAENLAFTYNQNAVAFAIEDVNFELTSGQAKYRRVG